MGKSNWLWLVLAAGAAFLLFKRAGAGGGDPPTGDTATIESVTVTNGPDFPIQANVNWTYVGDGMTYFVGVYIFFGGNSVPGTGGGTSGVIGQSLTSTPQESVMPMTLPNEVKPYDLKVRIVKDITDANPGGTLVKERLFTGILL